MKKKDYVGRFARLTRKVQTHEGSVIPADSIVKISATWRGKFTIEAASSEAVRCRGVSSASLDLLPADPREQARIALESAIELARHYGLRYVGYCGGESGCSGAELSSEAVRITEIPPAERRPSLPKTKGMPW